jgi:hypothetical protein
MLLVGPPKLGHKQNRLEGFATVEWIPETLQPAPVAAKRKNRSFGKQHDMGIKCRRQRSISTIKNFRIADSRNK